MNKIREEETKLEREVSSFDSLMRNIVSVSFIWNNSLQSFKHWAFFSQIEASKEHLETVQKQIKSVQAELSQVSD